MLVVPNLNCLIWEVVPPLIDLKSLPGVQATDIRMIDNDFNMSGVMTHYIDRGIELGDSILYNSEDAAKSTWACDSI